MNATPADLDMSDAFLDRMQAQADPLADETIARILGPWPSVDTGLDAEQWQRIATVNRIFGQWTDNASLARCCQAGDGVPADIAQALGEFVAQASTLPAWACPETIERAQTLFLEHGFLSCTLLFCASLPECYVVPDLASVLQTSGQLTDNTDHRIRSTAAMIFPVMMPGGLQHGSDDGSGIAQILKVRLIHATIRHLILRGEPQQVRQHLLLQPPEARRVAPLSAPAGQSGMHQAMSRRGWDMTHDTLPCNQEELAYTLLTFHWVFLRGLRTLGIGLPAKDEQAYLHAWNVVGYMLGIQPELMVHDMKAGKALMAKLKARGRARPVAPDPRPPLATALMATMENVIPGKTLRSFPRLMTRHLCGRATSADLGLTRNHPWLSRFLFALVLGTARLIDTGVRRFVPTFSISRFITRLLGFHLMGKLLMDETRPLKLPDRLLGQVSRAMNDWGRDPRAPAWLQRIEDRMTTPGGWSPPWLQAFEQPFSANPSQGGTPQG